MILALFIYIYSSYVLTGDLGNFRISFIILLLEGIYYTISEMRPKVLAFKMEPEVLRFKKGTKSLTLWASCWGQILKFRCWSYFYKLTHMAHRTDTVDSMAVKFKVACGTH
jgi:hypothetical protein